MNKIHSILQAAIEVFSNGSFKNSSISEIAKTANMAEGTIYQYYKNKEKSFFPFPFRKRSSLLRNTQFVMV